MQDCAAVILALDTATDRVHLALADGRQTHVQALPGGAQASSNLLPAMQALLSGHGRSWSDVQALACGLGPGAFTGLRTACSVAQGLAVGLDCPVLGLDTLMAVAEDLRQRQPDVVPAGQRVWVLQDARMGEMYVAAFDWNGTAWQVGVEPALWALDAPLQQWPGAEADGLVLAGSGLGVWSPAVQEALAPRVRWMDAQACPSGAALAQLARQAWDRGERLDAALLLPRYVRDKVAQTTAERLAGRAAERPAAGQGAA